MRLWGKILARSPTAQMKIKGMKGCLIESNDGTARKLRVCNAKKDTANGKRRQHHLFNRILFSTICI